MVGGLQEEESSFFIIVGLAGKSFCHSPPPRTWHLFFFLPSAQFLVGREAGSESFTLLQESFILRLMCLCRCSSQSRHRSV